MAVYIELVTERTNANLANLGVGSRAGTDRARRPVRGLEVKEDTYGMIKVLRADGTAVDLVDQSSPTGRSEQTTSFLLQNVQEARMEKHQIVETFGASYIFFMGESPRFVDVQAILINSNDFNWEAEWWDNYEQYFRGTRSVELGARTYLFYDDTILEGFVLNAQAQKMSQEPLMVQLSFRMFLTNYRNVSSVGVSAFPIRSTLVLPPLIDNVTDGLNGEQVAALTNFDPAFGEVTLQGPLRTNISDNYDEFTGAYYVPGQPSPGDPYEIPVIGGTDVQEAGAVFEDSMTALGNAMQDPSQAGALATPGTMGQLGLGPTFGASNGIGLGFSAGGGFSAGASFGASAHGGFGAGASAGGSFGYSTSFGSSFSASANLGFSANASAGAYFNSAAKFTASASSGFFANASSGFSNNSSSGFFASASAGFGANSSNGFFATSSSGSFAGAGYNGSSGNGASVAVGGTPTCFAFASFEGTLTPEGWAYTTQTASPGQSSTTVSSGGF